MQKRPTNRMNTIQPASRRSGLHYGEVICVTCVGIILNQIAGNIKNVFVLSGCILYLRQHERRNLALVVKYYEMFFHRAAILPKFKYRS